MRTISATLILLLCLSSSWAQFGAQPWDPITTNINEVWIEPGMNYATIFNAADTGKVYMFKPGWYDFANLKIDLPSKCSLVGTMGDVWLYGAGNAADSFFVTDADSVMFNGICIISHGSRSWYVASGARFITSINCYFEFTTMVLDSGELWRASHCEFMPIGAPVKTSGAEVGAVVTTLASMDFKWSRSGYDWGKRVKGAAYGWYFWNKAKTSSIGSQLKAGQGTAVITADSSGELYFQSGCMILADGINYALYAKGGGLVAGTNIIANGSNISGGVWSQDSAGVTLDKCQVDGDVRWGGNKKHYWMQSSLDGATDTLTCAVDPDTGGPWYFDNLDGIRGRGGVFIDSCSSDIANQNKETTGLWVYIDRGCIMAPYTGTERTLTLNLPGILTTSKVGLMLGPKPFNGAAGDTLTPIVAPTADVITIHRDVSSTPFNAGTGWLYWEK